MPSLDDVLDAAKDAIDIDLSGSVDFDDAPNGTYIAKLTKVEAAESKAGNPVLKWYFDVETTVEIDGDEPVPARGSKLPIATTNTSGKSAWRSKKIIKALGFDIDSSKDTIKFSPSAAVGRLVSVKVQQQGSNPEYQELTGFAVVNSPLD